MDGNPVPATKKPKDSSFGGASKSDSSNAIGAARQEVPPLSQFFRSTGVYFDSTVIYRGFSDNAGQGHVSKRRRTGGCDGCNLIFTGELPIRSIAKQLVEQCGGYVSLIPDKFTTHAALRDGGSNNKMMNLHQMVMLHRVTNMRSTVLSYGQDCIARAKWCLEAGRRYWIIAGEGHAHSEDHPGKLDKRRGKTKLWAWDMTKFNKEKGCEMPVGLHADLSAYLL
ncbi:hypothetical protein KCU85_g317, partial [Aureobasidium melanogenum]